MDLKDILPGKKNESKEHYWALTIEPGWIQAGIWKIEDKKVNVISVSPPTAWELEEELAEAVDTALSAAVQNFPEDLKEPSKTVFGVGSSWVTNGQIKEEYLQIIKKICSNLSLEPAGFVVLSEAIIHLIKSEEGSPTSAVLLGVSKENIEISLFKLGKIVGTSLVARSLSVVDDFAEGLARLSSTEPLPSRFVLFNGKEGELEEVRQALLKANWEDYGKIEFLHTPKIETVVSERKIHAISLAGGSEIGEVASVFSEKSITDDEKELVDRSHEIENIQTPEKEVSAQDLGFALGEDVAAEAIHQKEPQVEKPKKVDEEKPKQQSPVEKVPVETESAGKAKIASFFNSLKNKIIGRTKFIKRPNIAATLGKQTFLIGGIIFVLILVGSVALWWFYPKATVTIYLSTKTLKERVSIVVDPAASEADVELGILPGYLLESEESGEKTKSTTGTKTVGEKAKGEVTLYRVGSEISLAAGTRIIGPSNLEFSLDESVNVASGSAGSPGTSKAKTTAVDIGAQYNLAGGTTFSIDNYSTSDIEAKSESSFSGGSSREISAVSVDDQTTLEKELTSELKENSLEKLMEDLEDGKIFIEESLTATSSSRTFSDKVGDEASTLKLSLSINTQAIVIDEESLTRLAKEVLEDKVPDGFVLRSDQVEMDFEFEDEVGGNYELTVDIEANLLPDINPEEIADKIVGKYPPLVQEYLTSEIPGFSRAEIDFNKPRFPGKLATLPHLVKNIEIVIAAEK